MMSPRLLMRLRYARDLRDDGAGRRNVMIEDLAPLDGRKEAGEPIEDLRRRLDEPRVGMVDQLEPVGMMLAAGGDHAELLGPFHDIAVRLDLGVEPRRRASHPPPDKIQDDEVGNGRIGCQECAYNLSSMPNYRDMAGNAAALNRAEREGFVVRTILYEEKGIFVWHVYFLRWQSKRATVLRTEG